MEEYSIESVPLVLVLKGRGLEDPREACRATMDSLFKGAADFSGRKFGGVVAFCCHEKIGY